MTALDTTLARVTEETFASLAFMLSMGSQDPPPEPAPEAWRAAVRFEGPFAGTVELTVMPEMLVPLAGNMLGLEGDAPPTPAEQADALRELLNVICGNLLPELAGTEAVFHVEAPRLLGRDDRAERALPRVASCHMELDSGLAWVSLYAPPQAVGGAEPA